MPFSIALISTDDTNTASGTLKKANSAPAASKIINTAQSITPTVDAKKRLNGNTFAKQENARQAETGQTEAEKISETDGKENGSRRDDEKETTVTKTAKSAVIKNKGGANRMPVSLSVAENAEITAHITANVNAPPDPNAPFESIQSDASRKTSDKRKSGMKNRQSFALTPFINGKSTSVCNKTKGVVPPPKESETNTDASGKRAQKAVIRQAPFFPRSFSG